MKNIYLVLSKAYPKYNFKYLQTIMLDYTEEEIDLYLKDINKGILKYIDEEGYSITIYNCDIDLAELLAVIE